MRNWIENELIELINSNHFRLSIPIQNLSIQFQFNSCWIELITNSNSIHELIRALNNNNNNDNNNDNDNNNCHCHHIIVILIILSFHYQYQYASAPDIDYHYNNCSAITWQTMISMGLGSICSSLGPIDHYYCYHILIVIIIMLSLLSSSL